MAYLYFRTALRVCKVLPIIPTAEMSVVVIVIESERRILSGITEMNLYMGWQTEDQSALLGIRKNSVFGSVARTFGLYYICCLYCLTAFASQFTFQCS